jgi:hypothetical protein
MLTVNPEPTFQVLSSTVGSWPLRQINIRLGWKGLSETKQSSLLR